MPRTKRKQQVQNTDSSSATAPATTTLPVAPAAPQHGRVVGVSGGAKQKRKRRRKARTEVSDSDSSSSSSSESESDDSSAKRKVKSIKQKKNEAEAEKEAFELLAGKSTADGDAEMKDVISDHGGSPSPEEDSDEADGAENGEGGPKKRPGDFSPGKSRRIPAPLLHRDPTDPQSAQRFEEYYMQLITSEFGEELNQVRKAKDFSERSLPMLVRALKMGVNVFEMEEKRSVVRSLGL
ncbi:ribosome-assembly protein 3-domain-containing protein [Tirmania nivea]|nr:ribosome-assembly protein 3-domain-containing protein [Tirmania nivea]